MNREQKNLLLIFISMILLLVISGCDKKSQLEKNIGNARLRNERSITVINKTDSKLIKECILTTEDGTNVAHIDKSAQDNILFKNFDDKGAYKDEENFKITLIDRFGLKYEVSFTANQTGNTEIVVNESDLVKQKSNAFRKMERIVNKK